MTKEQEERLIDECRTYVVQSFPLSDLTDEELENHLEGLVNKKLKDIYCPIHQKVNIVQRIYSSIRGLGILDTILKDESITEVMINGYDRIFVEKNGRSIQLDRKFDSEMQLEDIIQRIVGTAGREVNQANPIVDTRLANGSRVNIVLPPVSLVGPVVTIRKFSKKPMTIEQLIRYGSITAEIAKDYNPGGSHQRNPDARDSGAGVCTEQHGGGLDF